MEELLVLVVLALAGLTGAALAVALLAKQRVNALKEEQEWSRQRFRLLMDRIEALQKAMEAAGIAPSTQGHGAPADAVKPAATAHPAKPHVDERPASADALDPAARSVAPPRRSPIPRPVPDAQSSMAAPPEPDDRDAATTAILGPQRVARRELTFEAFLGQRVFLVVGIVVVLLGLGWFLKYAIDRGWIGPAVRIALGVAAGIAALIGGDRLRNRYPMFGHGVMGGGLGALFLSVFFAAARYELIGLGTGYGVVALLAAGGAALALSREAPLLAHLGFFGGLLAPAVLSTGEDRLGGLTTWLLVVDAGILAVAMRRAWRGLDLMAAVATVVYFSAWSSRFGDPSAALFGASMLCLLLLGVLAIALVPSILRREQPPLTALAAAVVAGFPGLLFAHDLLFPVYRIALGTGALALAAIYYGGSRAVARRCEGDGSGSRVLLGFALATLAVAVPMIFSENLTSPVWAVLGVALVLVGTERKEPLFRQGGSVMMGLAMIHVVFVRGPLHPGVFTPFLNGAFLSALLPALAPLAAGWILVRRAPPDARPPAGDAHLLAGTWLPPMVLAYEAWAGLQRSDPAPRSPEMVLMLGVPAAIVAAWTLGAAFAWRRATESVRTAAALPFLVALMLGYGLWFRMGYGHPPLFVNAGFLLGLAVAAAPVAAGTLRAGTLANFLSVGGLAYFHVLLTVEILRLGDPDLSGSATREDARFLAQVWVSVAWALHGAALLGIGFWKGRAGLRWGGIVVFGLTLAKVLLFDMAALTPLYRIGSSVVLGLLLVGASYLYTRSRVGEGAPSPDPGSDGPGLEEAAS